MHSVADRVHSGGEADPGALSEGGLEHAPVLRGETRDEDSGVWDQPDGPVPGPAGSSEAVCLGEVQHRGDSRKYHLQDKGGVSTACWDYLQNGDLAVSG